MKNPHLHHYVFHYNTLNNTWNAIPRDQYKEYWNDFENEHILRSDKIETLIEILDRIDRNVNYLDTI